MIHDSTHRIFGISELMREIAGHLILVSGASGVNLACAARCIEEPVLSTLWETQSSLCTLLEVLPGYTWSWGNPAKDTAVVCSLNPPPEEDIEHLLRLLSSRSWRIYHRGLGRESSATRPGCTESA